MWTVSNKIDLTSTEMACTRLKIALVICLLVFILMEDASPDELVERGRKNKGGKKPNNNNDLELRVKALEENNKCKRK